MMPPCIPYIICTSHYLMHILLSTLFYCVEAESVTQGEQKYLVNGIHTITFVGRKFTNKAIPHNHTVSNKMVKHLTKTYRPPCYLCACAYRAGMNHIEIYYGHHTTQTTRQYRQVDKHPHCILYKYTRNPLLSMPTNGMG